MKDCQHCGFYGRPTKARLRVGRRIFKICQSCRGVFS